MFFLSYSARTERGVDHAYSHGGAVFRQGNGVTEAILGRGRVAGSLSGKKKEKRKSAKEGGRNVKHLQLEPDCERYRTCNDRSWPSIPLHL
jgi:hypothetical protein